VKGVKGVKEVRNDIRFEWTYLFVLEGRYVLARIFLDEDESFLFRMSRMDFFDDFFDYCDCDRIVQQGTGFDMWQHTRLVV